MHPASVCHHRPSVHTSCSAGGVPGRGAGCGGTGHRERKQRKEIRSSPLPLNRETLKTTLRTRNAARKIICEPAERGIFGAENGKEDKTAPKAGAPPAPTRARPWRPLLPPVLHRPPHRQTRGTPRRRRESLQEATGRRGRPRRSESGRTALSRRLPADTAAPTPLAELLGHGLGDGGGRARRLGVTRGDQGNGSHAWQPQEAGWGLFL